MKRKYLPIEKYPVYNKAYNRYQIESRILNRGGEKMPNVHSILWDETNLRTELQTIVGDKDGLCGRKGQSQMAQIPFVKMQLAKIEERFKAHQQDSVNSGFERPAKMPITLRNEKYQLEARLDILNEEREFIEATLKRMADVIKREEDAKVLRYGLTCHFKFHGTGAAKPELINVMKVIDGQMVAQLPDGTLYIEDDRSPYNHMLVSDYRKLAKQWVADQVKAAAKRLKQLQDEAKAEGTIVPQSLGASSPKQVSKANLPKWPEFAKPVKIRIQVSKSE